MTDEQRLQTARTIRDMLKEIIRMADAAELGMTSYLMETAVAELEMVMTAQTQKH